LGTTKTVTINITSIKNGFVVSGEDANVGGVFGQPLETDNVFFPDLDSLYSALPKIVRATFDLEEGGMGSHKSYTIGNA